VFVFVTLDLVRHGIEHLLQRKVDSFRHASHSAISILFARVALMRWHSSRTWKGGWRSVCVCMPRSGGWDRDYSEYSEYELARYSFESLL
jgi:hypothetical protein